MFKVGDKFYQVVEDPNVFSRKKISMTDDNGVEWYRYDKPIRSYSIQAWTIVGRVIPTVEGELVPCDWSPNETVLHCVCPGVDTDVITESELKTWIESAKYYFLTEQAAQAHIDETILKEKHI